MIRSIIGLLIALIALLAISLQLYITDFTTLTYFSFFTSLSNLLIAVSLFSSLLFPRSAMGRFFSKISVLTAIAVYIFIVSLVYNTVLRGILELKGLEYILDNFVHVFVPVLFVGYWLIFVRQRGKLNWSDALLWLIFPFLYLSYTLLRGSQIKWYPYPFLNALKLGYPKVFGNIAVMLIAFLLVGFLFIYINRKSSIKRS